MDCIEGLMDLRQCVVYYVIQNLCVRAIYLGTCRAILIREITNAQNVCGQDLRQKPH